VVVTKQHSAGSIIGMGIQNQNNMDKFIFESIPFFLFCSTIVLPVSCILILSDNIVGILVGVNIGFLALAFLLVSLVYALFYQYPNNTPDPQKISLEKPTKVSRRTGQCPNKINKFIFDNLPFCLLGCLIALPLPILFGPFGIIVAIAAYVCLPILLVYAIIDILHKNSNNTPDPQNIFSEKPSRVFERTERSRNKTNNRLTWTVIGSFVGIFLLAATIGVMRDAGEQARKKQEADRIAEVKRQEEQRLATEQWERDAPKRERIAAEQRKREDLERQMRIAAQKNREWQEKQRMEREKQDTVEEIRQILNKEPEFERSLNQEQLEQWTIIKKRLWNLVKWDNNTIAILFAALTPDEQQEIRLLLTKAAIRSIEIDSEIKWESLKMEQQGRVGVVSIPQNQHYSSITNILDRARPRAAEVIKRLESLNSRLLPSNEPANRVMDFGKIRRQAEQGDSASQYVLGMASLTGTGVEKNIVEAEKWLRKAAEQGNEAAIEVLQKNEIE